jgi:tRNA-splicing ligase RtcB
MQITKKDLKQIKEYVWEIPKTFRKDMRVPARIYASEKLMEKVFEDRSLEQLVNSATLPGVYKYVLTMPDAHEGYGLNVGGVVATKIPEGIISPGAVGYDIKCSVGLLASRVNLDEIKSQIPNLIEVFFREIPSGVGVRGPIKISHSEYKNVLEKGAAWAVSKGYGLKEDLEHMEDKGVFEGAKVEAVSEKAKKRGEDELGTLGAGNHFLELQFVEKIFDPSTAEKFGLFQNQICIMIHSGSRGLGHQVCTDYVNICRSALPKYGIKLPDPELACVPFDSKEGQDYFGAMAGAANYAYANHQILSHFVRKTWKFGDLRLVWHMGHNIACIEEYDGVKLCVHRKGAARCFEGRPVLIPGSMGTASYVLVGQKKAEEETFGSCAHGAGRVMSRTAAKKQVWGETLKKELEAKGIFPRTRSMAGLAEEAPIAYKDIDEVVKVVDAVGIAKKVARLVPLGVIKG